MEILDMRTVVLGYAISNFICLIVIVILWIQNRTRFPGLGFWSVDYTFQCTALALVVLRGVVPDLVSMTVSNALVIGGTILLYNGLRQFLGRRGHRRHNYILWAVFVPVHAYFVVVYPSLTARSILFSLVLLLICFQCAAAMLRRGDPESSAVARGVGYVFIAFCLVSVLRILVITTQSAGSDLFQAGAYETLLMLIYQMLFIILTFSLSLMVNRRLLSDLESDIAARKEMAEALRSSEEKYSKAFQAGPDAVLISRLKDGGFIEVNDSFCRLTGYSREEALSNNSIDLGIWNDPRDREKIAGILQADSRVRDYELDLRTRSGILLKAHYSGEIIYLKGEACILSVVRDISERRLAEAVIRLRLMLWGYSTTHSALEVMQKAIDEIETLTESRVGFFHLVDEERNSLPLQVWSSRTRNEYRLAESAGLYFPMDEADSCGACVRLRKPVVHNEYSALPHRAGIPGGNAELVRELVVPVMRNGHIVSILGIGNKPTDYDDRDIDLVSYIADDVWNIIERKQADEKIYTLNTRLEQLSMTDELTGLSNRRAFFLIGNEEIKKARRYRHPLALLMLDVDRFKSINDTYGHKAGDAALQCIANILLKNCRETDLAVRLGGDEFGVLMANTSAANAVYLADRLRSAIEKEPCHMDGLSIRITASIGVTQYDETIPDLDMLLHNADTTMYLAKNGGRNRVVCGRHSG